MTRCPCLHRAAALHRQETCLDVENIFSRPYAYPWCMYIYQCVSFLHECIQLRHIYDLYMCIYPRINDIPIISQFYNLIVICSNHHNIVAIVIKLRGRSIHASRHCQITELGNGCVGHQRAPMEHWSSLLYNYVRPKEYSYEQCYSYRVTIC